MKPSIAQAKLLARCWGANFRPAIIPHHAHDKTSLACIKRGWLSPTDERGTFPSGDEFIRYEISRDGVKALASALAAL